MRNILLLIIVLTFTFQLKAQNYDLPRNPRAGKCYERKFNLDEKYEWKEVVCEKIKKRNNFIPTEEDKIEAKERCNKIKKYQTELKNAGYEVIVNGRLDDMTITSHHKYLKQRKSLKTI